MNILLTNYCNAGCVYCFAANTMSSFRKDNNTNLKEMSLNNLSIALDYLKITSLDEPIRLLGGEPTLYPKLEEAIQMIINKGFKRIEIFSNGFINKNKTRMLKKYLNYINFVWNINTPTSYPIFFRNLIDNTLKELSSQNNSIGFNIYKTDYDPSFIFTYLNQHPDIRYIRIGIAHPMGSSNVDTKQSVIFIEDYPKVGTIIYKFAKEIVMKYKNIKSIQLDCGYTPCLFTDYQFKFLINKTPLFIHESCSPSLTDISVDLSISPCFATSSGEKPYKLTDFNNIRQVIEFNKARWYFTRKYLPKISQGCSKCKDSDNCFLGCGGERILETKKQRIKWINSINNPQLNSFSKVKLLFKIAQSFASSYEYKKAKDFLNKTVLELYNTKNKLGKNFPILNSKIKKFIFEFESTFNISSYINIKPELDLYYKTYNQLVYIKKLYSKKPTKTLLKEYTSLISACIFKTKLTNNINLSHYQNELKLIDKQKKLELKEYLATVKDSNSNFNDQYLIYSYVNLLKKYSGKQKATEFLRKLNNKYTII